MIYTYEMYFNDMWNDVTNYVSTNTTLGDRLDSTFNLGSFIFEYIKADTIAGIDLSKTIKSWIPVKVSIDSNVFLFYTSDCTRTMVKKSNPKLYKHEVSLIEVTKILKRKTIPDITTTQPKASQFTSLYKSEQKAPRFTLDNTEVYPTLTEFNSSLNTGILDGNILRAGNTGEIVITLEVWNSQYDVNFSLVNGASKYDAGGPIEATIYLNGIAQPSQTMWIEPNGVTPGTIWKGTTDVPDTPTKQIVSVISKISESPIDQTITIKLRTTGKYWTDPKLNEATFVYDTFDVIPYVTIGGGIPNEAQEDIYLDELVDRVLKLTDIRDSRDTVVSSFILDETRRADLHILAPEFTFTTYKAWDALEKAGSIINAIPEIKDDYKTVTFRMLDENPDLYYDQDMFEDETITQSLDTLVAGLEINTPNLIEEDVLLNAKVEPYELGWGTVRSGEELTGQLTDDNAVFKTRQPIQKIYKMLIKGVGVKVTNGENTITLYGNKEDSSNLTTNTEWDISSRVVEQQEWNVYSDTSAFMSDENRIGNNTRGNHIYYTQGSNSISGLGHKTLTMSDIFSSGVAPRALMEVIMSKCAEYLSLNIDTYGGYDVVSPTNSNAEAALADDHELFDNVLYRVYYVPLTNARSTIYKHDIFNSDIGLIDFINEQDKLNDTDNLGKYVITTLNKQGNPEYSVSGKTSNYNFIPKLGYRTYNDLVVSARDLNLNKNIINFTLTLSEDYINQSTFIGRNSQYRSFEIPGTDIVHRQDKYTEFIVLTKDINKVLPSGHSIIADNDYSKQMFTQNFADIVGSVLSPATYSTVDILKSKEDTSSVTYDMPVNAYSFGNTINLQLEFETNYSAGSQLGQLVSIGSDQAKIDTFVQYTNQYGQAYSADITLYPRGSYLSNDIDVIADNGDAYPLMNNNPTDFPIANLKMIIDKDAREKYGVNIEFPIISSDSSTIRTYPGIAKYNGMVRSKEGIDVKIALLESGYFPTVNAVKLNTLRTIILDNIGTSVRDNTNNLYGIKFNNLNIPANTRFEGYAVYEATTNELIYTVKEDIAPFTYDRVYNTDTMWFVPKKDLKNNTQPSV